MTSLLVEGLTAESYTTSDANHNIRHRYCRNILRAKKNAHKHKCKQILKNKLKKYKLRQDGKEDQDIIDVSETLVSSLYIRSPDKRIDCVEPELNALRPKNYLFRMVRRKQTTFLTSSSNLEIKAIKNLNVSHENVNAEEKKTNAFKLLMDSRNKSLGTNSPGKDKPVDETEVQELLEKKNAKVKRNLLLQKMAESKGSVKKKEMEEHQEKYIKKKMKKRAEMLKSMIVNREPKTAKRNKLNNIISPGKPRSPLDSIDTEKNGKVTDKPIKTLQLVDIFNDTIVKISPEKKHITKEDEEFLKKLSPSIRKKESMLSYFKKVEKDSDGSVVDSENDAAVIKVKLGTKLKKRGRKKNLSLNRGIKDPNNIEENEVNIHTNEDVVVIESGPNKEEAQVDQILAHTVASIERRKRKRRVNETIADCEAIPISTNKSSQIDDGRPKRNIKKPMKYDEEYYLSSSDEELHIFTPKKKKNIHHKSNSGTKLLSVDIIEENSNVKNEIICQAFTSKTKTLESPVPMKPLKLAPIFAAKINPATNEAKQKFLQSGVPEKIKKMISKNKDSNTQTNEFPKLVHVQQLDSITPTHPQLRFDEDSVEEYNQSIFQDNLFTKLLNMSIQSAVSLQFKTTVDAQTILKTLKETYPRYPVYRTYRLLRGKKKGEFRASNIFSNMDNSVEVLNCSIDMQNDNPDQLTWCDKYKCMSGNEIIGNFDSIKELRKWLVTWTENDTKCRATNDSDSSDYYQSDPDSRDSFKSNNNLCILSGPVGSGKTSSVYAVAAELCIKVIEVNASSKRTGKIMLQDLQEATQSHKVNRGTGSADNSQKSEEINESTPVKKRGRPRKVPVQPTLKKEKGKEKNIICTQTNSQENTRTAMSLILIDDADIVFDQDDGFCSAIMQLVQCSKRPVILITGSLSCPHLQRFVQCGKIMKMQPLLPNMLGIWLDIMCLADSGTCWPGLGAKVLNFYKGDIRKTINCLQFYVCSQEQMLRINGNSKADSQNDVKDNADDEGSSMSWADSHEDRFFNSYETINLISVNNNVNECMNSYESSYSNKIFNIWWSMPKIMSLSDFDSKQAKQTNNVETEKTKTSLEPLCNVLDSISISDYYDQLCPEIETNITSHPWSCLEYDSVSELENFDSYNRNYDLNRQISYQLVKSSISMAQGKLRINCNPNLDIDLPGMSERRRREKIVSRHNKLSTYLSPQSSLDRKALALDYWSFCRNVCRIEKSKTDLSSKRNNRFCHYLKSLSALCKSESFDSLASSLNPINS